MFKQEVVEKLKSQGIALISKQPVFLNTSSMELGAVIKINGKEKTVTIEQLEKYLC